MVFEDGKEFRSGHCDTTHWACDCTLARLQKLNVVYHAAKKIFKGSYPIDGFDLEAEGDRFEELRNAIDLLETK